MNFKQLDVIKMPYLVLDEPDLSLNLLIQSQIIKILVNIRLQRHLFSVPFGPIPCGHSLQMAYKCWVKLWTYSKCWILRRQRKTGRDWWPLDWLGRKDKPVRALNFGVTKKVVSNLHSTCTQNNFKVACIYGKTKQSDRELVLKLFADKPIPFYLATDVAAALLNSIDIKHLINYD